MSVQERRYRRRYSLFSRMPEKNIISWTAMIGGFTWNGFYEEVPLLFREMIMNLERRPSFLSLVLVVE